MAEEARERPAKERAAFIDEACGDNDNLRSKVESLLRQESEADDLLEEAIGDVLHRANSTTLPETVPPPSQLGKYEIVEKVGQGGFGVVYRGRDPLLRRNVAVKVCSTEDKDLRDRFFREGRIAAGLQHANVTTIHDLGVENDMPFLVQEFLTGSDLEHVICDQKELAAATKLDYLVQIARGLAYAHDEGVVHRDLKPSNIRLLESGTVKIMDFGIAKLLHEETDLTRTGTAIGTVGYLAPEQLAGNTIDARADIFSFGVLVYELLSYQRPFQGETFSQVSYRLLYEQPRPLEELWPACPAAVATLVNRCLAKVAANRYASMHEVLAELEPVAEAAANDSRQLDPTVVVLPPLAPAARPQVDDSALTTKIPVPGVVTSKRLGSLGAVAAVLVIVALIGWQMRGLESSTDSQAPDSREVGAEATAAQQPAAAEPSAASTATPSEAPDPSSATATSPQEPTAAVAASAGPPAIAAAEGHQDNTSATDPRPQDTNVNNESRPPTTTNTEAEPSLAGTPTTEIADSQPAGPAALPDDAPAHPSTGNNEPVTQIAVTQQPVVEPSGAAEPTDTEPSAVESTLPLAASLPLSEEQVKLGDQFSAADPEVVPPRLLSKTNPVYPKRARRHRQEARVVVAVLIDETGKVIQTVIRQSGPPNYGFNDAALEAARQATFEPATKRTVPGKMWTTLPFVFTLDRGD